MSDRHIKEKGTSQSLATIRAASDSAVPLPQPGPAIGHII